MCHKSVSEFVHIWECRDGVEPQQGQKCECGKLEWHTKVIENSEDIELCDCGLPYPLSNKCTFCGTHARNRL